MTLSGSDEESHNNTVIASNNVNEVSCVAAAGYTPESPSVLVQPDATKAILDMLTNLTTKMSRVESNVKAIDSTLKVHRTEIDNLKAQSSRESCGESSARQSAHCSKTYRKVVVWG